MGTQSVPSAMVLIGLALIMTLYTMSPVFQSMYEAGRVPYETNGDIVLTLQKGSEPLKEFMLKQTRQEDLAFLLKKQENPYLKHLKN